MKIAFLFAASLLAGTGVFAQDDAQTPPLVSPKGKAAPLLAPKGTTPPVVAPDDSAASEKGAKLKELIKILESITDDDYDGAVNQAPAKVPEQASSRTQALGSAYTTMAALEYHEAAVSSSTYAPAYERVQSAQETGWAVDLLKWLGNAAINYALQGGQTYVGRELSNSETAKLDRKLGGLEMDLGKAKEPPQQAALHFEMGGVYEQLAAAAVAPPSMDVQVARQEQRLIKLANLLKSFSDDDYKKALAQLPASPAPDAHVATRPDALKSVYLTLAALEYRQAAEIPATVDAQAVMVDTGTLKEAGWAIDVFKWLGNAAINYALNGGQTYVGRKLKDSPADVLDKKIGALYTDLAAEKSQKKKAALHGQIGGLYEQLAALAPEPEADEALTAKREARLRELADLLMSVSDDDYKQVLKALPPKAASRKELASRSAILHSSYATLAALEYRQASKQAPDKTDYAGDLKRISQEDAQNLVVNPETLQETGWAMDLLDVATLGGVGYLIYESQHGRHGGHGGNPQPIYAPPAPTPAPPPAVPPSPPPSLFGTACWPAGPACPNPTPPSGPITDNPPPPLQNPVNPIGVIDQKPPVVEPPPRGIIACGPSGECGRPLTPILNTCYGPGHLCEVSRQVAPSFNDLQGQLASADIGADKSADLHHQLGSIYEQLAGASGKPAAKPKPKPAPKAATKPAPQPAPEAAPAPAPEAQSPAVEPQPQPAPQPTKEELLRKDMKQMDDLEKEMRGKVQQQPPGQ